MNFHLPSVWTNDLRVAQIYAGKEGGVILTTTVEALKARGVNILTALDKFGESELLVEGIVDWLGIL
jgi:hypothetical protein